MKPYKPELYIGKVYHKRFLPKEHEFLYHSFFIKLSLNNLEFDTNIFFSINSFNLFSFNFKDHGYRNGESLLAFANDKLKEKEINLTFDDIVIHTYPRILGFVFNPVSFWYFVSNGEVVGKLIEVNNTFGGTKSYIIIGTGNEYEKKLQVSPFNQITGKYIFNFSRKNNFENVSIKYIDQEKLVLFASIYGKKIPFTALSFLKIFITNPLVNIGAVFFIHIEALKLYIKKVPFYGKDGVVYDK